MYVNSQEQFYFECKDTFLAVVAIVQYAMIAPRYLATNVKIQKTEWSVLTWRVHSHLVGHVITSPVTGHDFTLRLANQNYGYAV